MSTVVAVLQNPTIQTPKSPTRVAEDVWMKNVLDSLMTENADNLASKQVDFGWTTLGPWLGAMSHEQESEWKKRFDKLTSVRNGSKESISSGGRSKSTSKESSKSEHFNAENLPPTPPSESASEPEVGDSPEAVDVEPSAEESEDEVFEVPEPKKKDLDCSGPFVTRPKLSRGFASACSDKTRWRRTVESFDDTIDNEKLWTGYLKHFTTADLNWFSDSFMKAGGRRGYIGTQDAIATSKDYMCIRWNSSCANLLVMEDIQNIKDKIDGAHGLDFDRLVKFIYHFQQVALSKDEGHGFKTAELQFLRSLFAPYVEVGVRPRELFQLLEMLGHEVTGEAETQLISMYNQLNMKNYVSKEGYMPFASFVYFVQRVNQMDDQKYRREEQEKVIQSGYKDKEIEELRTLFDRFIDTAIGEMSLAALKEMFKHLMMPLNLAQTKEVKAIIDAGDQNKNGTIDFGEFVCLLRELWNRNFCDLKTLTQKIDAQPVVRRMSVTQLKESMTEAVGLRRGSMRRRSTVEMAMLGVS